MCEAAKNGNAQDVSGMTELARKLLLPLARNRNLSCLALSITKQQT